MGVATVNLLKDDQKIVDAAKAVVDKYANVGQPLSNKPEDVELHDRFTTSPAITELKYAYSSWEKAKLKTAADKDAALLPLRRALAAAVAADYALIHSLGAIRSGKYDAAKMERYVYAVDPKAMKVSCCTSGLPLV